MASEYRFRYRGRFISEARAAQLLNLKNTSKYVTSTPREERHFRYKGKFISEEKAKKLSRLPATSRFVRTEIIRGDIRKKAPGVVKSIEQQVMDAIKADRAAADARRAALAGPYREKREKEKRAQERIQLEDVARRAARQADDECISIEEALDSQGFDEDDYTYYDYESAEGLIEGYFETGEPFFDFETVDLEGDDEYPLE